MKSVRLAPVLLAALLLLCAACSPVAEVSPTSTPAPSPSAEPTQAATPTPEPTPEPSPHDWAGSGYSYTSEKLGVTLEFPPDWQSLVEVYDKEEIRADGATLDSMRIDLIQGWDDNDDDSGYVASIYCFSQTEWDQAISQTQKDRYDVDNEIPANFFEFGEAHVMAEKDGKVYILWLFPGQVRYETKKSPGFDTYQMVSSNLSEGQYEVYFDKKGDGS